jgi:hypothetical protein
LKNILNYYQSLNIYAMFVFNLSDMTLIYKDVITTLIEEQQKMNFSMFPCLKEANDSSLRSEYEDFHKKNISFLHQFYTKHPLVDLSIVSTPSDNVYKQRRTSLVIKNENYGPVESFGNTTKEDFENTKKEGMFAIDDQELKFEEIIGIGGSSTVYRGKYRKADVAIKVMKKSYKNPFFKRIQQGNSKSKQFETPEFSAFYGSF